MYLNTDVAGYLDEYLADGIPASSVKVREFEPNNHNYRDTVVQPYTPSFARFMLEEKRRLVYPNVHHYHLSRLSREQEYDIIRTACDRVVMYPQSLYNGLEFCMTIPSDMLICRRQESGAYEIDFIHLVYNCMGWSAGLGFRKPFSYFHTDVTKADGTAVLPKSDKFVEHFVESGKIYERVGAFGFNHFRFGLKEETDVVGKPELSGIMLRFERQAIVSLPELDCFVFFVQPNYVDVREKPEMIANAVLNASEDCYYRHFLDDRGKELLQYLKGYIK